MQNLLSGTLAFPLDDTYIHLQYAKQIALGNYFHYQEGLGASSGATSFLYAHVLALGYFVGFKGSLFLVWLYLVTLISLTVLYYCLIEISNILHIRYASYAVIAMVWLSGWLGWSFWSGMEIAMFSALFTWSVLSILQYDDQNLILWISLSLTSLCRPEGTIFLALVLVMKCFRFENGTIRFSDFLFKLPITAYAITGISIVLQPFVNLLTTGSPSSNGLVAKWVFYHPLMTTQEQLSRWMSNLYELILFLCGVPTLMNSLWDFVLPGTLIFSLLGFLFLWMDKTTRPTTVMIMIPMLISVLFISTIEVWHMHGFRYIAPFMPLFYCFAILGLERLLCLLFQNPRVSINTLMGVIFISSLCYYPMWLMRYAEHCTMISSKQTQTALWMNNNLSSGSKVAINDAGALAYYGNLPVYDMVGLVTNKNAIAYRMGDAGTYENLTALPVENRPQYAAVFSSWFEEIAVTYDIFHHPVVTFPDPFDTVHSKRVYRINWNYAGKEELPRPYNVPDGWELRDSLDVAHLESEKEHLYQFDVSGREFIGVPVGLRRNFGYQNEIQALWPQVKDARPFLIPLLKKQGRIYDYDIVDSGRRIDGEERFVLHNLIPERNVHVVMRTCEDLGQYANYHYRMALYVNGRYLENIEVTGSPWNWTEVQMKLPGELITTETVNIRIRNLGTDHFDYYMPFYYWAYQEPFNNYSLDKVSLLK